MKVIASPLLDGMAGVRHAFFTRDGGVSQGVYSGLNVGRGSRDEAEAVSENRRRAADWFGQPTDRLLTCYQVHSARAVRADKPWGEARHEADAVATATPGLVCGALSADCAPILLADAQARVVAAAHAGWRGALAGMAETVVAEMVALGAERSRIVAAVGPCIAPQSYEVGLEFLHAFTESAPEAQGFFAPGRTAEKRFFDLPSFVVDRLRRAGVAQAQWVGVDTYADEELYSNRRAVHRREGDYGRLLSAIMLQG